METTTSNRSLGARAAQALRALLGSSSSVKLLDINLGRPGAEGEIDMLAHIGVLGHQKLLACKVSPGGELRHIAAALDELRCDSPNRISDATPVLVAPSLSARARQLCTRCCTSYLDFHGDGRLDLGEMFIRRRSLTHSRTSPISAGKKYAGQATCQGAPASSSSVATSPALKISPEVRPAEYDRALAGAHSSRA